MFSKKTIAEVRTNLPREELLRRSRILIVDDERPALIEDLKKARFSVEYVEDITKENLDLIDRLIYDLILLDFGNVGKSFGNDEGLALLRHIRRVYPACIVLAYTSKSLGTTHADFYRLADGVLAKDAGITESMQKIEDGLRQSHSLENIWKSLLTACDIKAGSRDDSDLQDLLIRSFNSDRKKKQLRAKLLGMLTSEESQQLCIVLLGKAIEIGVRSSLGG